jgi:hypothetical protein
MIVKNFEEHRECLTATTTNMVHEYDHHKANIISFGYKLQAVNFLSGP